MTAQPIAPSSAPSSSIAPFSFDDHQVRVIVIDGEPWFVLADLCKVLELSNPTMVASRLDGDALSTAEVIDSVGRNQVARIVNESGLYEVIFMSRKPDARRFRRWITSEVLPSIRRTGGYGVQRQLTPDEIVAQALQITAQRVEALTAQVAQLEPKAAAWAAYMNADGTYAMNAAAKILGTGRNRLMADLRHDKVLNLDNCPRQAHIDAGRFAVKASSWTKPDGTEYVSRTTRVTAKGMGWLVEKYGRP